MSLVLLLQLLSQSWVTWGQLQSGLGRTWIPVAQKQKATHQKKKPQTKPKKHPKVGHSYK